MSIKCDGCGKVISATKRCDQLTFCSRECAEAYILKIEGEKYKN